MHVRQLVAALLTYLALVQGAKALDFTIDPSTGVIHASGPVELDDAEQLASLVTQEYRQQYRLVRDMPTLSLDSSGGSLLGGLKLGFAIRKLGVQTTVTAASSCFSACALAFLGGQARTVEGRYGVHATSFHGPTSGAASASLDTIQQLSAVTTAYVQEMTGRSDVAIRALSTSAASISVLSDSELVAMRVITVARRPSQFGSVGFKCPSSMERTVLGAICANLDIAEMDMELNDLYSKISSARPPVSLAADQSRWRRYRNSCIHDGMPNGFASVTHCIRTAYSLRRDQLLSIWLDISAKTHPAVASDWKPHEPLR